MMNLYSGTTDPFSHRCRIVLFEKGMDFEVIDVDLYNKPEDIAIINPYNRVPVLVDRDLVNRAWQYRAHNTQAEVLAAELGDLLARVPDGVRLDALARLAAMLGPHERAAVANR